MSHSSSWTLFLPEKIHLESGLIIIYTIEFIAVSLEFRSTIEKTCDTKPMH